MSGAGVKGPRASRPYRIPVGQRPSAEYLQSVGQLFGRSWTDSAFCLPWADFLGMQRFAVLSPSYGGDVLICRFRSGWDGWWCEPLDYFVTGVTHWRLAAEGEQDSWLDPEHWPAPGAADIDFRAQRWHWLHVDGRPKGF